MITALLPTHWAKHLVDTSVRSLTDSDLDAEAGAHQIKQRFPHPPIILLSAHSDIPGRILWLVDYVMKSEFPERLPPIIERTCRFELRADHRSQHTGVAA